MGKEINSYNYITSDEMNNKLWANSLGNIFANVTIHISNPDDSEGDRQIILLHGKQIRELMNFLQMLLDHAESEEAFSLFEEIAE